MAAVDAEDKVICYRNWLGLMKGDLQADMKKNVSHASGGDKNILVGAKFTTSGSGTPGQTTASFEASHAAKNASDADFADGVVRYSGTTTTTASKYTGE